MEHERQKEEERWIRDAALDQTIAESFPASDAPSTLPNPVNRDAVALDRSSSRRDPVDGQPDER